MAVQAGATKAQAWYSTTGSAMMKAAIMVTLTGTMKGVMTPVAIMRVPCGSEASMGWASAS